jgi:hypothetical protein
MTNAVVEQNEVFLNGVYYPTTRPVRSTLASIYPAKIVIGDTTKDSNLRSSVISWSDWRGGIGINRMEGAGEVNRAWYSTCQLRYRNHLVLPGLATASAVPTHTRTDAVIGSINTYGNEIYAAWNGSVSQNAFIYKYNNAANSWSQVDTAGDRVTDSVAFTDGSGNSYLVFAHYDSGGSNYTYYNGSSWITASGAKATKYLTTWDERHMAGSHNELLVGIDARAAPASIASTSFPYQWISHHGARVIEPTTGYSSILGYNDMGWEVKWQSGSSGIGFDSIHVSDAYDEYRVWWGHNGIVYFMALPKDIINPSEVGDFSYATSGVHETPWFNAGQSEVEKLALKLRVEAQDLSANETVKVEYALNYNDSLWYDIGDVPINSTAMASNAGGDGSSGTYTQIFGSKAGTAFRAIKFKITLNREDADTTGLEKLNTPDVVSLTLEYRKKIEAKWGHTVDVDLTNEYKGNVPKDLRSSLISAIESETLVEFTFRDDGGGTRNYYVDVIAAQGMEFTGHDERGSTTIQVVEP